MTNHQFCTVDVVGSGRWAKEADEQSDHWCGYLTHELNESAVADQYREIRPELDAYVVEIVVLEGLVITLVEMDNDGQDFTEGHAAILRALSFS